MKNLKIYGKRISTLSMILILIGVTTFSSFGKSTMPLFAKGIGDTTDSTVTPPNPDIEKKKEEERKVESEKRAYQDQQDQQRIQKEKEEQRLKDEAKRKEDERRENERREREAQEARNREEQQRRDQEAQRRREEADRIAEQQRQEQDRQYREDQQRQEKIRQEQERAYLEQQAQAAQDEQNRIAVEEQLRRDQEARDSQERQNRLNNIPIENQQQDIAKNPTSIEGTPDTQDKANSNNQKPDPNAAFKAHYKDPFFYPYDLYSYANYPYDSSSYTISLPKPVKKAPAKIRRGSADEAMFDISYAWKNRSSTYLIKHTTRRTMINVYYNARYSHTLNQKQFFELTTAAFLNTKTYNMKFSSIKKTPVTLYFKLKHDFYDPDKKPRQVSLAYYMKKINGVWLIQRLDITRNKK